MTSPESISTPDLSNCGQGYETRSPVEFVKTVLKPQVGNTEEFLEFERYFYYQTEELNSVKKAFAELQTMISKLQEGKRSMELQLVSEKSLRDQESRNSLMEIEKLTVQCNAQIYSIKCEAETWKRKAEAATTEATWLKDQMKNVEMEKNLAANKLNELKSNLVNFEQHRKSFEFFYARERELMKNFNQKLDELEHAKVILEKIIDSNQKQLDLVSVHLRDWQEEREKSKKRIAELEDLLMSARAEIVQSNSKLERAEMRTEKTKKLVEKLVVENEDLSNGLKILTSAVGDKFNEIHQQLLEKSDLLRTEIESSVKRLSLNNSDLALSSNNIPPTTTSSNS